MLTAIRYDDWDKFIWCIEDQGVSVNVLWPDKQNQSPLLAACARVRTRMIKYMIAAGADVQHRNAGNFTAAMYTRKLTEYDSEVVLAQLRALQEAGLDTKLSVEDELAVRNSGGDGRIFIDDP
jgi:ankyrin repeat protein